MQHLSASRLLNTWERGRRLSGVERALLLLAAAAPEDPAEATEALPIGPRDSRILDLRAAVFGPRLDAVVSCPACGERLEFAMAAPEMPFRNDVNLPGTLSVSSDGYEIAFRLPTSEDLVAVAQQREADRRSALLDRCIRDARRDDLPINVDALPETVVAAVVERMAAFDPSTTLQIDLACPGCGHEWHNPFDIVAFLWAEVDAWAMRTLYEVHALASAYGWGEADILAMSAWRRHRYMQMVEG